MAQPTLDEYLAAAKPLNPGYSDEQIASKYHEEYPTSSASPATTPSLDEYLKAAKPLNPGYSDEQITQQYQKEYPTAQPTETPGFGSAFVSGMKQGVQELGAAGAGTIERLQTPDTTLKSFASDAAKAFEEEAKKFSPSRDLSQEPWYNRLRDPEVLGNLFGNVLVQSAPSLAGAAVGGVLGGPPGAAAGMLAVTYFQQAGQSYRDAYQRYTDEGLSETEAHDKAYTTSGIAGLVSGAVNALAVPASLVAPFTSKLKNLALNYVANVAVDTGDQLTQNIVKAGTYAPETSLTAGVPEAVVGSMGLSAPETIATIRTFGAGGTAKEQPPQPTPTAPIEPILQAPSVDEAITAAQKVVEAPPITAEGLDQFIKGQAVEGMATGLNAQWKGEKDADQSLLTSVFSDYQPETGEVSPITTDDRGNTFFAGSPLEALHPQELPRTAPPNEGLSQDKYDVLSAIANAMGKNVVIFRSGEFLPEGLVHATKAPSTIFLSSKTRDADLFSVFSHEAVHLMQGTTFHDALADVVWGMKTPEWKQLAIERHGELPHRQLLNEVVSDIAGTELHKPEVWQKVFTTLQERVGTEQAQKETLGFIETIKNLIAQVKELIASRPWSTGFGPNKKTMAEQYVTDLTKVHDALAEGVANVLYEARHKPTAEGVGTQMRLALSKKAPREIVHPEVATLFTQLANQQRGAPESAMLRVQKAVGGGVMNPVVENVGDLIHRMTESAQHGLSNKEIVLQKIERSINALTHSYGFQKEHHENLRNNARYDNKPVDEVRKAVDAALVAYTAEHKKLPTYNLPQWLANQAAVAVGEQRFEDAVRHLKELKALVEAKDFTTRALEVTRVNGKIAQYARPLPAKLIGKQESGSPLIPPFELYNLEEAIPGHPVGSTVSRQTIEQAGYRPQPTDLIRQAEATRLQKAAKEGVSNKSEQVNNKPEKKQEVAHVTEPRQAAPDTEGEAKEEYDYASTQIDLAPALAQKVLALGQQIKTEDLADKGREDDPHITVKYGLHSEDPKQAIGLLQSEAPITATIGDLHFFETEDGDVVVLNVDSPALVAMNEKITTSLENTTERVYHPHITVAFVKAGKGQHYVDTLRNPLKGTLITADTITFSNKKGEKTAIKLGQAKPGIVIVNIGLNVNDGTTITAKEALAELKKAGVKVASSSTQVSNTEPTLVATLDRPLTPEEANTVSTNLKQESVAQKVGDVGELYGPGAEKWKPFNNDYFLMPERAGGLLFSKSTPPIGISPTDLPANAKSPNVDWQQAQAQNWVTAIPKDWKGTGWGKGLPTIYRAYLTNEDMPQVRASLDLGNEYDWKQFKKTGIYPPIVVVLHQNGIATKLEDGHHRMTYWREKGFDHFPAWIVDFRKGVKTPVGGAQASPAKPFFSQLQRTLADKMPAKAMKEQVQNILKSPGVKEDEVKWSGIQDYLDAQKGPIDKNNLLSWLAANEVRVTEVVKRQQIEHLSPGGIYDEMNEVMPLHEFVRRWGPTLGSMGTRVTRLENTDFPNYQIFIEPPSPTNPGHFQYSIHMIDTDNGNDLGLVEADFSLGPTKDEGHRYPTESAAMEALYEELVAGPDREARADDAERMRSIEAEEQAGATQYEGYKLPGGEDYTELLLTLPVAKGLPQGYRVEPNNGRVSDRYSYVVVEPKYNEVVGFGTSKEDAINYIQNKEMTSIARADFRSPHFDEPNILAHVRFDTRRDGSGAHVLFLEEVQSDWHEQGREKGYVTKFTGDERKNIRDEVFKYPVPISTDAWNLNELEKAGVPQELRDRWWEAFMTSQADRVPQAPFSKSWPELVMKRMLRWASEHNYDRLAWTTGAQQNERYGLSKVIDGLEWELTGANRYALTGEPKGGGKRLLGNFSAEELPGVIGKELAQKIVKDSETRGFNRYDVKDLEVGGSGMKYFYDQMLPRFMEKYLKRFGTTVDAIG